jgi:hypothetical protein
VTPISRFFSKRAESYFKTAYACCGQTYDRTFIDNHYARHLLESAVVGPEAPLPLDEAEKRLEKAKSLLHYQFNEDMYYPYRVATNLEGFLKLYGSALPVVSREGVVRFIDHILQRAEQAISKAQAHKYIFRCVEALNRAKKELASLPPG